MQDEKHLSMEMVCEGRGKRTASFHRAIKHSDLGLSFIRDQHSDLEETLFAGVNILLPLSKIKHRKFFTSQKKAFKSSSKEQDPSSKCKFSFTNVFVNEIKSKAQENLISSFLQK